MKVLLTIALMLFAGLTVSAQGSWTKNFHQADALKGMSAYYSYYYNVPGVGSLVCWDWEKSDIRFITEKGMFREMAYNTGFGNFRAVKATVGIYKNDGELQEKFDIYMNVEDNSMKKQVYVKDGISLRGDRKNALKVKKALRDNGVYVRVICSLINMPDFDLKITPYNEQVLPSTGKAKRPAASTEITQEVINPIQFFDGNDYSTPDEVMSAANNKNLKITTLNKGEKFVALAIEGQKFMLAKVQLTNGKVGWVYPAQIPNRLAFLPLLPFRDEFLPNIDSKAVAPGMTKEEVFIVTGNYISQENKSYKSFGDYINFQHSRDGYMNFYKNSLYLASSCNGAFWYKSQVNFKLVNVSRNETIMDDSIRVDASTNYSDDLLFISWNFQRNYANFALKNNATSSIKIIWDDMAFVGLDGKSMRIIHKGIKYDDKTSPQAPSVVSRNSKIIDYIIPSDRIYYNQSLSKWSAFPFVSDVLYSPDDETSQHPDGEKIQILFPVIINEKRYEYQFVFEIDNIKFSLMNSDYNNRTADVLQ